MLALLKMRFCKRAASYGLAVGAGIGSLLLPGRLAQVDLSRACRRTGQRTGAGANSRACQRRANDRADHGSRRAADRGAGKAAVTSGCAAASERQSGNGKEHRNA